MTDDMLTAVRPQLKTALREDCPGRDITTLACIGKASRSSAVVIAKQDAVIAGLSVFREVMSLVDGRLEVDLLVKDGIRVKAGRKILRISGKSSSILTAERVALNYLQRMTGIATLTSRFVDGVRGTRTRILDTRKTTPNMRVLEKYAVRCGGGHNHRMSLSDVPLIKENHIRAAGGIKNAVALVKGKGARPVILEVTNRGEVVEGLEAGADILLLDNMTPAQVRGMVKLINGRAEVEVSGGVNLKNVRRYALAGADRISVGAITHSVPAADLSLLFI